MESKLLNTAVTENHDILLPILQTSYMLTPLEKYDVMVLAQNINQKLGYKLFDELYYPTLIKDFSIVTRAMQIYNNNQEVVSNE